MVIYRRTAPNFTYKPNKFTSQVRQLAKEAGWLLPISNITSKQGPRQ
jgi:hypothetical protein